jgi:hypothetical protein
MPLTDEHPLYANRCELAVELVVTSQAINRDRSGSFEISLYGQT